MEGYEIITGNCAKHGKVDFVKGATADGRFTCTGCIGEDFAANEQENIEIAASMNLNNIER